MEKIEVKKIHEDSRGKIYSIKLNTQELILWTLKKDYIRGGNFHKSIQHDIIISGDVLVTYREKDKDIKKVYTEGEYIKFDPQTPHMFMALTDDVIVLEWLEGTFEKKYFDLYRKLIEVQMR